MTASLAFVRRLGRLEEVVIKAYEPSGQPTEVRGMHRTWRPAYLPQVQTPEGMPRLEPESLCPAGSRLVEIECVRRRGGGMESYYGFEGHFLSLIVAHDLEEILDARGEPAS